jgi:recombination protein RecR
MPDFAPSVTKLIDELKRLPGIGQKTAQRLAFYLLRVDPEQAFALSDAIRDAKEKVRECTICNNITDTDPCIFCASVSRNTKIICVVEEATNIQAVEKTRQFDGLYHVLGGALSPLQGIKGRRGGRNYRGDESDRGGRGDGGVFVEVDQAAGRACDPDCDGDSGGVGFGICG